MGVKIVKIVVLGHPGRCNISPPHPPAVKAVTSCLLSTVAPLAEDTPWAWPGSLVFLYLSLVLLGFPSIVIDFPWISDSVLLYPESVFLWTVSLHGGMTVQLRDPENRIRHVNISITALFFRSLRPSGADNDPF